MNYADLDRSKVERAGLLDNLQYEEYFASVKQTVTQLHGEKGRIYAAKTEAARRQLRIPANHPLFGEDAISVMMDQAGAFLGEVLTELTQLLDQKPDFPFEKYGFTVEDGSRDGSYLGGKTRYFVKIGFEHEGSTPIQLSSPTDHILRALDRSPTPTSIETFRLKRVLPLAKATRKTS